MKTSIALLAALLAGCGSGTNDRRTVTGQVGALYWNPSHPEPVRVAADLRDMQVEAVQDGQRLKGVARSDGTFHIDGVKKDAPYWLRLAQPNEVDQYILTSADTLSFDDYALGTDAAAYPTQPATQLTLHLSGLQQYAPEDGFEYFDPDTATLMPFWPFADPGAESADAPIGWFGRAVNPEGVRAARVSQIKQIQDAEQGISYYSPVASAVLPPFTVTDGFQDEARAPLAEIPAADLQLHWRISDFAQQAAAVHPKYAAAAGQAYRVWAQPGARDRFAATGGYGFPVVLADLGPVSLDADFNAKIGVRSSFPNDWIASRAGMFYSIALPIPDAPDRSVSFGTVIDVQTAGWFADAGPLITPPTMPRVEGKDAFEDQAGIPAEPTISWNLPQKGKATEYAVTLLRWADLALAKVSSVPESLQPVAVLVVPGDVTSLKVPPGLLQRGESYVAVIESVHAGENDFKLEDRAAAPYRTPQPYGNASAVTSTFRVTN